MQMQITEIRKYLTMLTMEIFISDFVILNIDISLTNGPAAEKKTLRESKMPFLKLSYP